MSVFVTRKVRTELDDIWAYIATESASLEIADRVVEAITDTFLQLAKHPNLGRRREDLRPGLRTIAVASYVIVYRIAGSNVRILHVVHGRRDLQSVIRH